MLQYVNVTELTTMAIPLLQRLQLQSIPHGVSLLDASLHFEMCQLTALAGVHHPLEDQQVL